MRVFVTGATGFIGSAVVQELISAGHQVLGLSRSEEGAKALLKAGAEVHRGNLEDLDSLRSGAEGCDGTIHTGFIHDFSRFKEVCEMDRRAIEALGNVYLGSERPLVSTSGIALLSAPGRLANEEDTHASTSPNPRIASEEAADVLARKGVRVSVVRLPPSVHDKGDHGFVPMLIDIAREKGCSVYKGEGLNRWPAVHRLDAARLFRLALEKCAVGGTRYHAIGEEGIAFRTIAEAIGSGINVPTISKTAEEADRHFSWFAHFAGIDCPASGKHTEESLGWKPQQQGLIEDIAAHYFKD